MTIPSMASMPGLPPQQVGSHEEQDAAYDQPDHLVPPEEWDASPLGIHDVVERDIEEEDERDKNQDGGSDVS